MDGFSACFSRRPQRDAASQYLDGLFNDSERKSMQAMHGRLSDPGSYQALQHFITHSPWEASRVWTQLRSIIRLRPYATATPEGRASERHRRVALSALASALAKIISVSTALISVPLTLHYLGRSNEALEKLAAGLKIDPQHQRSWLTTGFVNLRLGNATEARAALTKARDVGDDTQIRENAEKMLAGLPQ